MDEQKIVACIDTLTNAEGSCIALAALFEHLSMLLEGHVQIKTGIILRGVSALLTSVSHDLAKTSVTLFKLIEE
jgi:hypothetical protein